MVPAMKKVLLTIAGFDPSGGAGVLLDTAVFRRLGFHGAAVLTAVTAQGPTGVLSVRPVEPSALRSQYRALIRDLAPAGIKVGMTATAGNLAAVGRILDRHASVPRVVDPVLRSSSGAWLLERKAVPAFLEAVRGRASLLTPNLEEAGRLSGRPVATIADMEAAARAIFDRNGAPCLVKGGHLAVEAVNVLFDGQRVYLFGKPRLRKDVHGTGCFFSAALLAFLSRGRSLPRSCELATEITHEGIRAAGPIGRGRAVFSV
jgi:hydroxymethylpyrimidine kinase/phosphomethylpyrimidine kinase